LYCVLSSESPPSFAPPPTASLSGDGVFFSAGRIRGGWYSPMKTRFSFLFFPPSAQEIQLPLPAAISLFSVQGHTRSKPTPPSCERTFSSSFLFLLFSRKALHLIFSFKSPLGCSRRLSLSLLFLLLLCLSIAFDSPP